MQTVQTDVAAGWPAPQAKALWDVVERPNWLGEALMITNAIAIVVAGVVGSWLLFSKFGRSRSWSATAVPLGSIMGSGFLVVAPLLAGVFGAEAVIAMALLTLVAYGIGGVIRGNIIAVQPVVDSDDPDRVLEVIDRSSSVVLAVAYVISVAFYLGLLSTLLLDVAGIEGQTAQRALTTAILATLLIIGLTFGFKTTRAIERIAVSINLAAIAAFLAALAWFNADSLLSGEWEAPPSIGGLDLGGIRQVLGMLLVVQGFEISRYLGDEFSAEMRVKTMKQAQGISTVLYLLFIGLLTVLFGSFVTGGDGLTATVDISGEVASALPVIVLIAAFGAQLSASVADADGGAGLLDESLQGRVSRRTAVALLLGGSIVLTWITEVGHVIAIASRAFAAYYLLQTVLSIVAALRSPNRRGQLPRILARGALGLLLLVVLLFALPVE